MFYSLRDGHTKLTGTYYTLYGQTTAAIVDAEVEEVSEGRLNLTGYAPTLAFGDITIDMTPPAWPPFVERVYYIKGFAPKVGSSYQIPVGVGAVTAAGAIPLSAPTAGAPINRPVGVGSAAVTGYAPALGTDITIGPVGVGAITATGLTANLPDSGAYEPSFVSEFEDANITGEVTLTWRNTADSGAGPSPGDWRSGGNGKMKVTAVSGVLTAGIATNDLFTSLGTSSFTGNAGLFLAIENSSSASDLIKVNLPVGSYRIGLINYTMDRQVKLVGTKTVAWPWKFTTETTYSEYTRLHNSGGTYFIVEKVAGEDSVVMFEDLALGPIEAQRAGNTQGVRSVHESGGRLYFSGCLIEHMADNLESNDESEESRQNEIWRVWQCVIRHGGKDGGGNKHNVYIKGCHLLDIQRTLLYDPGRAHCVKSYNEIQILRNNVIINKLSDSPNHSSTVDWGSFPIDNGALQDCLITNNTLAIRSRELSSVQGTPSVQTIVQASHRNNTQLGGIGLKRPNYYTATDYVGWPLEINLAHWANSNDYFDYRVDNLSVFGNLQFVSVAKSSGANSIAPRKPGVHVSNYSPPGSSPWNGSNYWRVKIEQINGTVHSTLATWNGSTFSLATPTTAALDDNASCIAWPAARGQDARLLNPECHDTASVDDDGNPNYYWSKVHGLWTGWNTDDYYRQHIHNNTVIRISSESNRYHFKHAGSYFSMHQGDQASYNFRGLANPPQWDANCAWAMPAGAGTYDEGQLATQYKHGTAPSGYPGVDGSDFVETGVPLWVNNPELAKAGPLGLGTIGPDRFDETNTGNQYNNTSRVYQIDANGDLKHQGESPVNQTTMATTTNGAASAGLSTITVVDSTGMAIGDIIHIQCNDDPWAMATNYWFHRTVITLVVGNVVTLETALEFAVDNGADVLAMTPQTLPAYVMTQIADLPLKAGIS